MKMLIVYSLFSWAEIPFISSFMDYHLYISPITRTAPYLSHCFTWKWVQWNSVYPARGNGGPGCVQPAPTHSHSGKHLPVLSCVVLQGQEWASFHCLFPLKSQKPQCQFSFSSPQHRTKNILGLSLDFPSDLRGLFSDLLMWNVQVLLNLKAY